MRLPVALNSAYESYDLFKTSEGWKIISLADTDNPLNGKSADEVCPEDSK